MPTDILIILLCQALFILPPLAHFGRALWALNRPSPERNQSASSQTDHSY